MEFHTRNRTRTFRGITIVGKLAFQSLTEMMESQEYPNSKLTARFVQQNVEFCILEQMDEITNEVHTITVTREDAMTIMMRLMGNRKPAVPGLKLDGDENNLHKV